jgi:hypothetical protein
MQSSLQILKDIQEEYNNGSGANQALLEAIGLGLADGIIRSWSTARKYGWTATKLYQDINSFEYDSIPDTVEHENYFDEHILTMENSPYDRSKIVNNKELKNCRESSIDNSGLAEDVYDPGSRKSAQTMDVDHVVALKNVHKQMSLFNYAPIDEKERKKMAKDVANTRANLLIVNRSINRSKRDAHNVTYVLNNWDKLKPAQRSAMLKENARAQTEIAAKMAVGLTTQDLKKAKNVEDITNKLSNSGTRQVLYEQVGSIINVTISPIWYEIKDIAMNGVCHGLNTDDYCVATGLRLKRVFMYIIKRLPGLIRDLFKDIGRMLYDLILSIVTSLFKKFLFVIKEGFKILIQAFRILIQPNNSMTTAQKGDAILKLIGTLVPALIVEAGLSGVLKPYFSFFPPGADIAASVISAILAALISYMLDKMDLFSVKSEMRYERVKEIFDARKHSIFESTRNFNIAANEVLKKQRLVFETFMANLDSALSAKDFERANTAIDDAANFFHVKIPYGSSTEFIDYIRSHEMILIGAKSTQHWRAIS